MNTSNHKDSRSDNEANTSETKENKDSAINQYQNDSSVSKEPNSGKNSEREDGFDPYFQKNSDIAQDLHEDLKKTVDPDREKNDEYNINTPGTVDDENGENN